jgi:hypothetical protein
MKERILKFGSGKGGKDFGKRGMLVVRVKEAF